MQANHTELIEKQELLQQAAQTLKQEFVGLDGVIDEVTESVSSWYLFPHMQDRPVVINLWGLTGVGKSSLVERLAELINYREKFFHFDLGNKSNGNDSVKNSLEEVYNSANGFPSILAFDEFQHARTLTEMAVEQDTSEIRVVWQLLDSGKFQFPRNNYYLERFYNLIQKLKHLLGKGVEVVDGYVVQKQDFYLEMMNEHREYEDVLERRKNEQVTNLMFFPSRQLDELFDLSRDRYNCIIEMKEELLTMDGPETISFLEQMFVLGNSPRIVDCSQSLIFVLGNLDEVYTMSRDFNPDRDADDFHEQSLKINIPLIKGALKKRFRSEQIARLGNNHIIYPAFSRSTYEAIIRMELDKLARKVKDSQQIQLQFDTTVHSLIYQEGVYPTQGTRPVFTTIHQLVSSKLGKIMSEMLLKNLAASEVYLHARAETLVVQYRTSGEVLHELSIPHKLSLGILREDKCDDMQAIAAVHESGHAIVLAMLFKTLPELILSNSTSAGVGGSVMTKLKWKYISRKEVLLHLALLLGGLAAEKVVFGEENVTTGAEEDIAKATEFVTEMLKSCGMGGVPGAYHTEGVETRDFLYDTFHRLNDTAEEWLNKALELAENTLQEQEVLLLQMADYLSDQRRMDKEQMRDILGKYAVNFDVNSLIENGDLLFYRKHLKNSIERLKKKGDANTFDGKPSQWPQGAQLNYGRKVE